jgi:hypothetical protein
MRDEVMGKIPHIDFYTRTVQSVQQLGYRLDDQNSIPSRAHTALYPGALPPEVKVAVA